MALPDPGATVAQLLANPEGIAEALALLNALERLEVVIRVNGTEYRGALKLSEGNAIVEVDIITT